MKKYKLIKTNAIEFNGKTLYQIKALRNFANIKINELGGYIESEYNLTHEGTCWVYGNAKVCDYAKVRDNAKVCDNAIVYGYAIVCDNAIVCGKYPVLLLSGLEFKITITDYHITIGCYTTTLKQIINESGERSMSENKDTLLFWNTNKTWIIELIKANRIVE